MNADQKHADQNLLLVKDTSTYRDGSFTIMLGPGVVRYLKVTDFLNADVEEWLDLLRGLSLEPQIVVPSEWFYLNAP